MINPSGRKVTLGRRVGVFCWKSAVILPEERGYIARRVGLYCRKSAVTFWLIGVILNNANNSGYLTSGGRVRLYCWKSAVLLPEERALLPEERGYIPVNWGYIE